MKLQLNKDLMVTRKTDCSICGSRFPEPVISLPNLPLTGIYTKGISRETSVPGFDQNLFLCKECGHAQLSERISASILYDESYSFRTSLSATAKEGTDYFLSFLNELTKDMSFNCVIDIGCNDLYLLEKLKGRANQLVGIDPVWASAPEEGRDEQITVIGKTIEETDLGEVLKSAPDLILCRHTLEHISEPKAVFEQLLKVAADKAIFLFEVPSFDCLLKKFRFDLVFHQHLHYFSFESLVSLLREVGCELIASTENYHHWGGTFLVAFKKSSGHKQRQGLFPKIKYNSRVEMIIERFRCFQRQLKDTNQVLNSFRGTTIYGYGAAFMLPVLFYHLGIDSSLIDTILDDDPEKDGLSYINLPVIIRNTASVSDISDSSILLTALNNVRPTLKKALQYQPKHIIIPLNVF